MPLAPFHAMTIARELTEYINADKLAAAYASADVKIFPGQNNENLRRQKYATSHNKSNSN